MKTLIVLAALVLIPAAAIAQSSWQNSVDRFALEQKMQRMEDEQRRERRLEESRRPDGYERYMDLNQWDGRLANPYEVPRYDLYAPARRP